MWKVTPALLPTPWVQMLSRVLASPSQLSHARRGGRIGRPGCLPSFPAEQFSCTTHPAVRVQNRSCPIRKHLSWAELTRFPAQPSRRYMNRPTARAAAGAKTPLPVLQAHHITHYSRLLSRGPKPLSRQMVYAGLALRLSLSPAAHN